MATIEVSIAILASPPKVWAYLADIQRQPQWMSGIHSLETTSETAQGVGAAFRVVSKGPFGTTVVDDMVCTEWVEVELLTMEHRGRIKGKGSMHLVPIELGTRFRWREELRMPLGLLGELAFRLLFRRALRRTFNQDIRKLKALVESGQDTGGPEP